MKNEGWPKFSFTELLSPPDGWRTDHAILSTYSADLVVIVTALLALTGCDLDSRRTGSRVELVKAIEALRGSVRTCASWPRGDSRSTLRPILKLLDKFLRPSTPTRRKVPGIPKVALFRFHKIEERAIASGGYGSAAEISRAP